jgi:hypothetical protein
MAVNGFYLPLAGVALEAVLVRHSNPEPQAAILYALLKLRRSIPPCSRPASRSAIIDRSATLVSSLNGGKDF